MSSAPRLEENVTGQTVRLLLVVGLLVVVCVFTWLLYTTVGDSGGGTRVWLLGAPIANAPGATGPDGPTGVCNSNVCVSPVGTATSAQTAVDLYLVTQLPASDDTIINAPPFALGLGTGGFFAGGSENGLGSTLVQSGIGVSVQKQGVFGETDGAQVTLCMPSVTINNSAGSPNIMSGGYLATSTIPLVTLDTATPLNGIVLPPSGTLTAPVVVSMVDGPINYCLGLAQLMPDSASSGWYIQYTLMATATIGTMSVVTPFMQKKGFSLPGTDGANGIVFGPVSFSWNTLTVASKCETVVC